MNIPIYELTMQVADDGVDAVAIVAKPAVNRAVQMFDDATKVKHSFAVSDKKKGILCGVAMLADTPIYRNDKQLGEYYVYASKDTISKVAKTFIANSYAKNIKFTHQAAEPETGAIVFEIFQCDSERGILPMRGFEDVPDGSLFMSADISQCPQLMAAVESGEVTGYSVEGLFTMIPIDGEQNEIVQELNQINTFLQNLINKHGK
jgi:hypothetical protein